MWETVIIGLLFILALIYLTKNIWQSALGKKKCSNGCGACSTISFDQIQPIKE